MKLGHTNDPPGVLGFIDAINQWLSKLLMSNKP